jgi:hypothetical protein
MISNKYSYPIEFYQAYIVPTSPQNTNSTLVATLDQAKTTSSLPILAYLSSQSQMPEILDTRQKGNCLYFWNNTYYEFAGGIDPAMGTMGETEQWFEFQGPLGEYGRYVKATDGYEPVLVVDKQWGS